MIILGLTGSIAMGKSTVAAIFRDDKGVPVHDADRVVRDALAPEGTGFSAVAEMFPLSVKEGVIDRGYLSQIIFGDPKARKQLEDILHPLVVADRKAWLSRQNEAGAKITVLDIPLLYETGGDKDCDAVAVVRASSYQQRRRALSRDGMTEAKLNAILEAQMSDCEKCARADFIIPTHYGISVSRWYIERIIQKLERRIDA